MIGWLHNGANDDDSVLVNEHKTVFVRKRDITAVAALSNDSYRTSYRVVVYTVGNQEGFWMAQAIPGALAEEIARNIASSISKTGVVVPAVLPQRVEQLERESVAKDG